jgi:hypothetical protein
MRVAQQPPNRNTTVAVKSIAHFEYNFKLGVRGKNEHFKNWMLPDIFRYVFMYQPGILS